jgi:peptidyl-tRNA hydrolase, PTH1 family
MTISNIKLIVGLGNPEDKYVNTRHNIGYKIVDNLLKQYNVWPFFEFFDTLLEGNIRIGYNQLVYLLKPTTGMNSSGVSVSKTIKELNLQPSQIVVIHDDVRLPFGTIRLRESGSAGGHNGVKSIIDELGTQDFNRLKIGVGHPNLEETTMLDYVLGDFTEPQNEFNKVISFSSDIITNILQGVITHGDTFNVV